MVAARSQSREASTVACMVAMAVTSVDEVRGAVASAHVVVARAEKPDGELCRRSSCCCAWGAASGRGPRPEM
jgi:hypothetical protein